MVCRERGKGGRDLSISNCSQLETINLTSRMLL